MVHYFERLVEKWQSRRKTLEISSQKPINTVDNQQQRQQQQTEEMENNQKEEEESKSAAAAVAQANRDKQTKLRTIQEDEEAITSTSALSKKEIPIDQKQQQQQKLRQTAPEQTLILCPTLLYASICLLLMAIICSFTNQNSPSIFANRAAAAASPVPQIQPPANNPWQTRSSPLSALTSLSVGLIQQLASNQQRQRWAHVPSPPPENSRDRPRPPTRNRGQVSQAIQRLRNRIGARNTIRVHNAFRDFAWRILSSLSMPTPVIYEIRRQHLYAPEDDQMNDMLHARNTSRTIRSKRFLDLLRHQDWQWFNNSASGGDSALQEATSMNRSDSDDDDDDSLRQRAKDKLLEVIRPRSRRSLLGNALRLPSIFPFKRHQEDVDKTKTSKRRNSFLRRRRKKESDRQMITIDGKQYYVDDDGKLKEVKDDEEIPDR